jgi:hypothetical protein
MRRIVKVLLLLLLALVLAGVAAWGALAIYYSDIRAPGLRSALSFAFAVAGVVTVIALILPSWRWRMVGGFLVAFAILVAWWNTIAPSNDRPWLPEVAKLAYATIDGDLVTVHDIRNFDYRTETDFTPAYYDKTFDVRKLESVDLVAVYWMGPAIAHTILSFGFEGGDHLAVSIETRKEVGEGYSTIKGFFKQFELYYVVADERDVIRVRSNYRKNPVEDVYVYRVNGPVENGRRLFLEYMRKLNALKERPKFYNTLIHNCTTTIWLNTRINPGHLPFSWKLLASGHVPQYLYEAGRLDTSLPFEELQRRSHVNARAHGADQDPDFSAKIREGIPGMAQ